ncbi:MAG: hypothetical protein ABSD73_05425 [Candidatus Bathyarchaeia archaeon]|jgi:hypothetical protein
MKYKALIFALLLLLPLVAATSIVRADWPIPPPPPQGNPILFVDMNNTGQAYNGTGSHSGDLNFTSDMKVYGPCVVSTNFPVDVRLWNNNATTGVDVYAFDFTLDWAANTTSYITLVGITTHLPTGWQVVYQDTLLQAMNKHGFHFAATDVYPDHGILVANNISLVTLTFHIDNEPVYNDVFHSTFELHSVSMSGDGTVPVALTPEIDNGNYYLYSKQSDIHLFASDQILDNSTGTPIYVVTERAVGVVHTIKVYLSDITHAFGFMIQLVWDSRYKETDIQHVRIGPDWILANYFYENVVFGEIGTLDYVNVTVIRPLPPDKPLICSTKTEAFEIDLTVISPDLPLGLPTVANTSISVGEAWLLEYADYYPLVVQYNYVDVLANGIVPAYVSTFPLIYSCDMRNFFNPKKYDLNEDGTIDIKDLMLIIDQYGNAVPWHVFYDTAPYNGANVDIFDIVAVAKNFKDP